MLRVMSVVALASGCAASSTALGVAGTAATGNAGGFTVTANGEMGFRVGKNVDIGLTSNIHFGNWRVTGNAYGQLNDWASSGAVECCDKFGPIVTFFKYAGIGIGYMTAWFLATNALMTGLRLRYYVNQYAPTMYVDLGVGPSGFFDEDASRLVYGIGATTAVGYMFSPWVGVEARATYGNAYDPQWGTVGVNLVFRPKKRFGIFSRSNDLKRPPPPPLPPPPMYPEPFPQQPPQQQPMQQQPMPPQPMPPQPMPPQEPMPQQPPSATPPSPPPAPAPSP